MTPIIFLRLSLTLAENKETPVTKSNDDDNDDDDNDDDSDACNDDNGDISRILPAFDFKKKMDLCEKIFRRNLG